MPVLQSLRKFELLHTVRGEKAPAFLYQDIVRYGCADGAAVFHYGNRKRRFAERCQYAGLGCGGCNDCRKQDRMFFCCPFDALGSTMATYGGQNIRAPESFPVSGQD